MNNISLNEMQMRRHSIYSVISQEKEKENDRIRILRKFMFENKIRFKNKHNYTTRTTSKDIKHATTNVM